jgi:murein DD-endopeptidase MepM/ murein hydrolase activator NlpD
VPQSWAVNQTRSFTVSVTNVGNSSWPAGGSNPVHLGLRFMPAGSSTWLTDLRITLPADVAPGQSVTINVTATAPATTSAVTLELQMVKEQQFWFRQLADVSVRLQGATWLAGYDMHAAPSGWTAGQTQPFDVTVFNAGNQPWPATGVNQVRLGLHFAPASGQSYASWLTDQRFALPADLAPGQSATLHVSATAPAGGTPVVLEAQMVKEWQFWFDQSAPMAITTATPTWAAGYDMSRAPTTWTPGQTQTVTVLVTNTGNQTWPSTGVNPVRLSLHFASAPGLAYNQWATDQRVDLPADIAPGQSQTLTVSVTAPTSNLPAVLEVEAVKEWQFWFPQTAAAPATGTTASWLAGYDMTGVPQRWVQGQPATVTLTVVNTGNQTWPSTGTTAVRLSLHFATAAGLPYSSWLTDQRLALPADLAPGQRATLTATITPPAGPGATVLEAQMVKEWQFWFSQRATTPSADAAPTWMAGYDLSQAPRTWTPGQTQTFTVTLLNAGNQTWPAGGANPVHLGVHFAASAGAPITSWLSDQRVTLAADLAPNQTVALSVTVTAPAGDTGGILEVAAVKEAQFWFTQRAPVSFLAS